MTGNNLAIATVTSANDPTWRRFKIPWPEFVTWFDDPEFEKDCGGYVLGRWGSPKRHPGDIIESRSAITLDADEHAKANLPDLVEKLGYSAIIHTTWRSTPEAPRYRVIILLDRSVTPDEYVTLAGHLMDQLGREQFDKCSLKTGQIMFLPSVPPEHPDWYRKWVVDGVPAPVEELLAKAPDLALSGSAEAPKAVGPSVSNNTAPAAPEGWAQDKIDDLLSSADNLASLPEGARLPWPGSADGVGWDMGFLWIPGQLIEISNSSGGTYTLEQAEADFLLHSPPKSGSYDPYHKWEQALKHVGGALHPGSPAADLNAVTTATATMPSSVHSGQILMAERLAAAYAGELLYVKGTGWHYWDGERWAEDDRGHAERDVVKVLKDAIVESAGTRDKKLRANAQKCESAGGIAGVLTIASKMEEFAFTIGDMDADPNLLNCANGILDLTERKIIPHDSSRRCSKIARGAYDPNADQTEWLKFLGRVLPDQGVRRYLQQVVGQAVYGGVREQIFPVLTGTGANGKGTFYGALVSAFGDYATVVNAELLMAGRDGKEGGPEMMALLGARLVVASELARGRVMNDALMKKLTGGDMISARQIYQKEVKWVPTHQLLYVTNHKPKTAGDDDAVWRRMKVIPFDVVIPEKDRDAELGDRLILYSDAILTWAVDGWFDYLDHGVQVPSAVKDATDAYQKDSDDIARFVEECCDTGRRNYEATVAALWFSWQVWRDGEGCEVMSKGGFGADLERRGFKKATTGHAHTGIRKGIQMKINPDEEQS